jgi:hypothetical protein
LYGLRGPLLFQDIAALTLARDLRNLRPADRPRGAFVACRSALEPAIGYERPSLVLDTRGGGENAPERARYEHERWSSSYHAATPIGESQRGKVVTTRHP